jgi:very-short-patch-repair endonuclease
MSNCKFCNREYIGGNKKNDVLKHEKYCLLNPDREKYICDKCNREFDKRHSLIGHKKCCGKNFIKKENNYKKNYKKNFIKKENNNYECKYCHLTFDTGFKLGGHITNCKKDPNYEEKLSIKKEKLSNINKGKKLSEETKTKISKSRKEYLLNNPDKVPYLLNHSRNESYPEKYFWEIFEKENIVMEKSYRIGLYELDFSIPNKKINIEIDGDQHYYDQKILESDIRRNKYLEELGWDIIRIRWSDYQKMENKLKEEYIMELFSYINGLILKKPTIEIPNNKKIYKCECGKEINKRALKCTKCYQLSQRKVERPSLETILKDIKELGYKGTGRKYGVSDNTIRKWIK